MLNHRSKGTEFLLLQTVADLMAVLVGLSCAYWLRFHAGPIAPSGGWDPWLYMEQLPWAMGLWFLALNLTHNYQNHPRVISFNRARRLFKGSALAIALIVVRNYFWRVPDIARLMYPYTLITVTACLLIGRFLLQRIIVRYFMGRSLPRTRVLIIGLGTTAIRLAARLRWRPEYAYEQVGFVASDAKRVGQTIGGVPVLGTTEDIRRLLREHHIQEVFVAQSELPHDSLLRLFMESEMETVRVNVIPTLTEMMRTQIFYDEIASVPIYTLRETPLQGWNILIKRGFDIAVSMIGLCVLIPVYPILAFLIKRSSSGPAVYRQARLGVDGQEFTIYKFRTMPLTAEPEGPQWGSQDDARATPIGRFLRRWNIDELPQLWNVLRGDMSLVGPRPERPYFVDKFREAIPRYMARHKVRTGLTGWAQVHGLRGDTSISQRLRYDMYYIENWSLWLDIKILIMTFLGPRRARRVRRGNTPPPVLWLDDDDQNESENSPCPKEVETSTERPPGSQEPAEESDEQSLSPSHVPGRM
ncbi:undecaprenyl-phosphate glucose phosphotransferase [bacterium]|nr:undecaprenyl-phosphate glucose phosphotransferase [bacterium]